MNNKNCIQSLFLEKNYLGKKMTEKKPEVVFKNICSRVHLLNILEEEDQCNQCTYCKFVIKLKESLEKSGFFSTWNTVEMWKIEMKAPENEYVTLPVVNYCINK